MTWETNLEVLSDLTNETLEGQLADQELSGLLVTPGRQERICMSHRLWDQYIKSVIPNLTKSDGTGAEPVGLLDTTSGVLRERHAST